MIHVRGLWKAYRVGEATQRVLCALDMDVGAGETVAITGVSGSGKSTLLGILGATVEPDAGSVVVAGRDVGTLTQAERLAFRQNDIGMVFQEHRLLPQLTALENVLLPSLADSREVKAWHSRATELLEHIGMAHKHDSFPKELSGGERQRVAVARALLRSPKVLLADEPTGALDSDTASQVIDLLVALSKEYAMTLVMVTHSDIAARAMHRTQTLHHGILTLPQTKF